MQYVNDLLVNMREALGNLGVCLLFVDSVTLSHDDSKITRRWTNTLREWQLSHQN